MKRYLAILSLVSLTACSDTEPPQDDATSPTTPSNSESGLTFYSDVQPILNTYCTRCHQEGGQGVGNFSDPNDVMVLAERMMTRMDAGTMPPPASKPDCREYLGSENLVMPDTAKETIRNWIAEGKVLGAPTSEPVELPVPMELANPNMQILMPTPYTPTFSDNENPGNEYRCFALEHGRDSDFFINAFHPILGERGLIHHVVLFRLAESSLPNHDPALGWDCIDGMGDQSRGMIAAWAPGAMPVEFDSSKGIRVKADERLVVQMHYFHNGSEETLSDQSGYSLRVSDSVETEVRMWPFGDQSFTIPAGDESFVHDYDFEIPAILGQIDPDATVTIYATGPHMHVLGKSYKLWVERAGSEDICLAEAENWDFNNQVSYVFNEPLVLKPGDRVRLQCTWDNSESNPKLLHNPPIDVSYGERTDEEMCYAFTLLSLDTNIPIDF